MLCVKTSKEFLLYLSMTRLSPLNSFTGNKQNYALVISDLRMPGLNGLELLKKIKSSSPNVTTILMSAYNFEENELFQRYMKVGIIDSTIEKPVTNNRLCQRVRDEFEVYQLAVLNKIGK